MSVLKTYRKARRLNQKELAELLGVSVSMVSHLEKGIRRITPDKAVEWEPVLGIPRAKLCPEVFEVA